MSGPVPSWTEAERLALEAALLRLGERFEVEELLGRGYELLATEGPDGVEYGGPGVGGWLRVRYAGERVVAVTFLPAEAP